MTEIRRNGLRIYHSVNPNPESQQPQRPEEYNFYRRIQKEILDKLEELSQRVSRLEISEGLNIVDTSSNIEAIPFKNKDSGSLVQQYV